MSKKMKCKNRRCGWQGKAEELLVAPNPFDHEEEIMGCPQCKDVDTNILVCDEPDCWVEASCGIPTANGYRNTCGKHMPTHDYEGWQAWKAANP